MDFSFIYPIISARKNFATYVSERVGAPVEQIIIITTMAVVVPFSLFNYFLKGRTSRLLYSLIVGFMFHYSIYGLNSLHTIFATLFTY